VAKGFELLGNKEQDITLRLGGIYALEGVLTGIRQIPELLRAIFRPSARTATKFDRI